MYDLLGSSVQRAASGVRADEIVSELPLEACYIRQPNTCFKGLIGMRFWVV